MSMLQTLIQIGQQVSQGRGEWEDIIDVPDFSKEKKKGLRLLSATMLFDIDEMQIVLDENSIKEFSEDDAHNFKNIKIQGGNNKAIYTCVFAPKSLEQLRKTFWGILDKEGKSPERGQFREAIDKDFPQLSKSLLSLVLEKVFTLRQIFQEKFIDKENDSFLYRPPQKEPEKHISISQILNLGKQDYLVLLNTSIRCSELGIDSPTLICELDGYEAFMKTKFLQKEVSSSKSANKLCYATGEHYNDVGEIAFNTRYNINKMFVTTTRNYASNFSKDGFDNSYQASNEIQKLLERGSEYVLNNHSIQIAGINHCIIPHIFSQCQFADNTLMTKLTKRSELLFRVQEVKDLTLQIDDADTDIYWLEFYGYESDGNFFKTINHIKDVSKTHFSKLLKVFQQVNRDLNEIEGMEWQNVMSRGKDAPPLALNFQTLYSIIPLRKDKEKKNEALVLFKSILEQRQVDAQKLLEHFVELALCHRYHRHKSFNNIYAPETISDNTIHFDFAIRNATYQYLAIFQVLKRLNLLKNMEENINNNLILIDEQEVVPYQQKIEIFFNSMGYSEPQKAMFYLGRALNGVAYAQVKAKHINKPILEKVNYNGMDTKSILKLYADLREKVKQYTKHNTLNTVEPNLGKFDERFQPTNWKMSSEEALFFMFSGYSFRIPVEKTTENN
jgi:CRISPR-associated protein Csh1